jgi:dolichol-phosphate mannosyltransferase
LQVALKEEDKYDFEILIVDDGSDVPVFHQLNNVEFGLFKVKVLRLTRNFGHQAALIAGLTHAMGHATITIDSDLQDPPETIPLMLREWETGVPIVITRRVKRIGESVFKRFTASLYYKLLDNLSEVKMPRNVGDFRLIDKEKLVMILSLCSKESYLRGLIPWTGIKYSCIDYVRKPRARGRTKYSLGKMVSLALDGITSFSIKPLRFLSYFGTFLLLLSLMLIIWASYLRFFSDSYIGGWYSIICTVLLVAGFQFLALGILGEFIGRLFLMNAQRPLFIVDNMVDLKK